MKKIETKKETIIDTNQVMMMERIENEIINELIDLNVSFTTDACESGNFGYLQKIKFNSEYSNSALINKATAVFVISIRIEDKLIGMIKYYYEVTPNNIDYLQQPTFKKGNFKLLDKTEQLFTSNIEMYQNETK